MLVCQLVGHIFDATLWQSQLVMQLLLDSQVCLGDLIVNQKMFFNTQLQLHFNC